MDVAKNRLLFVLGVISLFFLGIAGRVTYLSWPDSNEPSSANDDVILGPIQDRRGLNLAVTEEASTIAIAPPEIMDPEFTAEALSPLLEMDVQDILKRIYVFQDRRYFLLKRQVDNFTADRIMELRLPGVHREGEFRRYYPGETLASNLIGFVGRDQNHALAGLEYSFHRILSTPESRFINRGPTLQLTIDSLVQYRLESVMAPAFIESESKRATGILMDLKTGEILAMANFPNFNPNRYWKSTPFQRGNWSIRLNYEPGSTMKIFMASILLNERAVQPWERFVCDGEFREGSVIVRDKHGSNIIHYGNLTLEEIIQHSSNVGIIKAMQRINRDRLFYYLKALDFGEKTGVLPEGSGETSGYLPDLAHWVPSNGYYMPIGQGFSVTPIQLLKAASSIANGGHLVDPYLDRDIVSSQGTILDRRKVQSKENPFRPGVNREVLRMMRKVVTDGTGRRANIAEIEIAGKTGTAQKSSAEGYGEAYVASFLGFFPADRPRYGGLIVFDEPKDGLSGGSIAAPVFADMVKATLPLLESESNTRTVRELSPLPPVRLKVNPDRWFNFQGLSSKEALGIVARYYGTAVDLRGAGYVYKQIPAPGTPVQDSDTLILYLDDTLK